MALQDPDRFPWFLPGAVGDWLPLVERAFAVAVPGEHAQALATLGLAAVRGLQLDLLATGERVRTASAYRELIKLFSLSIRPWRKAKEPQRTNGQRAARDSNQAAASVRRTNLKMDHVDNRRSSPRLTKAPTRYLSNSDDE